jgi:hypothetical protein
VYGKEAIPVLTRIHRQEALSRAYVQAVAAKARLSISAPTPDCGIELSLNDIEVDNDQRRESPR